jgi:hypothetical protein
MEQRATCADPILPRLRPGTTFGGLASVKVYIVALTIVVAGLAAPFVMLSMQDDSALQILSEPAALDLLDVP